MDNLLILGQPFLHYDVLIRWTPKVQQTLGNVFLDPSAPDASQAAAAATPLAKAEATPSVLSAGIQTKVEANASVVAHASQVVHAAEPMAKAEAKPHVESSELKKKQKLLLMLKPMQARLLTQQSHWLRLSLRKNMKLIPWSATQKKQKRELRQWLNPRVGEQKISAERRWPQPRREFEKP